MKKRGSIAGAARWGVIISVLGIVGAACTPTGGGPSSDEHRVAAGDTARNVHVFVLGDSWSVDAASPLQLEAVKDYIDDVDGQRYEGVANASEVGPIGSAGSWGYAGEWIHEAVLGGSGNRVVEVSNFGVGGVTVRGWLHEEGPCAEDVPSVAKIPDGCYEEQVGHIPSDPPGAEAMQYYRLDRVLSDVESVPSDTVPVVYVSLGAGDVAFYDEALQIDSAAARRARLTEIESQLSDLVDQLRGAHPRAEVVLAGYTNFADQNALAIAPNGVVFDFGTCDEFPLNLSKRSRMINALLSGYGNPGFGCMESGDPAAGDYPGSNPDLAGGLDGVLRRVDRDADLGDAGDRVHFASRDHAEIWPNWTMFSHANRAVSESSSPSCVLDGSGFHLKIALVGSGCDNARGRMNPAKTFAIETACDWRLVTRAFD